MTIVGNAAGVTQVYQSELRGQLGAMQAANLRDGAPDWARRLDRLERIGAMVRENQAAVIAAIDSDFGGRAREETMLGEIFTTLLAVRHAKSRLAKWMRPRRRAIGLAFWPARARLLPQPLGVVGIISPWNYPLFLALSPLVGAVAAAFSELPFDHLLYTGSASVGRKVMAAAAENLTPVTLELGGKSPAIIGPEAALDSAVESIVRGKLFNAGQTCVAPDYVLVPKDQVGFFVAKALAVAGKFYPILADNPDYSAILNQAQFDRLQAMLAEAAAQGARVVAAGTCSGRKLPLTMLLETKASMTVRREEIFGPLLPIIPYDDLSAAIAHVNGGDRPLALYVYDRNRNNVERVLRETISGGAVVNDCLLHAGAENLPFGGVGASGMGQYHGTDGFETFSKLKPVVYQSRLNAMWLLHPPYGRRAKCLIKFLLKR